MNKLFRFPWTVLIRSTKNTILLFNVIHIDVIYIID